MHAYRNKCVLGIFVVMLPLWMSVSMATGPVDPPPGTAQDGAAAPPAQVGQLVGDGPFGQFIVKYRSGDPSKDPAAAREHIQRTAQGGVSTAGAAAPEATWLRRLGVGADVFRLSQPLDRAAAERLMQQFAADPRVEYIEVDSVMTIQRPTMGGR